MGWVASVAIETAMCGVAWKKGYEAHISGFHGCFFVLFF